MTQLNICPICQLINDSDAQTCLGCGRALIDEVELITERVAKVGSMAAIDFVPATGELKNLPANALALFVAGEEKPIVLEEMRELILGRPMEGAGERALDLTDYGAVNCGVSRRHVLLSYDEGSYKLVDLGSTNGTQLNEKPIVRGRPYPLRPFDQITLGQLKIMVFFQAAEELETGQSILLKASESASQPPLTPDYLAGVITPYLLALMEIQQIRQQGLGQPVASCYIQLIQVSQKDTPVCVRLIGADDAIQIVHQWVTPWQKAQINSHTLDFELTDKLRLLVEKMSQEMFGDELSEKETAVIQERLLTPVTLLATSGLELIWEPAAS